jgi:hypothetical protein
VEAHQNHPALIVLMAEELSDSVAKCAGHRGIESTVRGGGPVDGPPLGFYVVEPKSKPVEGDTVGEGRVILLDVRLASPERALDRAALELVPVGRTGQRSA